MGRPGAVLGASWAVLDTWKSKEANMLNMYVSLKEWDDVCLLGVPLGASSGVLGASWAVLKPYGALFERSWAVFGPSWTFPTPSWR